MNRHGKIESVSRCGIFADVQNIFYSAKSEFESKMDYAKLMEFLAAERDIVIANAYITSKSTIDIKSFEDALKNSGYDVKKKLYGGIDGKSQAASPSWEAGMSIDMMHWSTKLDTIILVSGNGAFVDAFKFLKGKVRLELANFKNSTSKELLDLSDDFINLSEEKVCSEILMKTKIKSDQKYVGLPVDEEEESLVTK